MANPMKTAIYLPKLLAALDVATPEEAVGAIEGLKAQAEHVDALTLELAKLKRFAGEKDVSEILRVGEEAGKITPANKASFLEICGATVAKMDERGRVVASKSKTGHVDVRGVPLETLPDVARLSTLIASLPVIAPREPTRTRAPGESGSRLSARQKATVKRLGVTEEDYIAQYNAIVAGPEDLTPIDTDR